MGNKAVGTLLGLLAVLGIACTEKERSYCNSYCPKCGRGLHVSTNSSGKTSAVSETELSRWLSKRVNQDCDHDWRPASGWSSVNNQAWDAVCPETEALRLIMKLDAGSGSQVDKALKRYFEILKSVDREEQFNQMSALGAEIQTQLDKAAGAAIHGH